MGLVLAVAVAGAQQAPVVTTADYARAEQFLTNNVVPLVSGIGLQPIWLSGDRLGYRSANRGDVQFVLVDPSKASRVVCSPETDRCGGALDPHEVSRLRAGSQRPTGARPESLSPDGKRAAFIRSYNLWVRDVATGRETQLTTDGQQDFGYATDNAGWVKSDRRSLTRSGLQSARPTRRAVQRAVAGMSCISPEAPTCERASTMKRDSWRMRPNT